MSKDQNLWRELNKNGVKTGKEKNERREEKKLRKGRGKKRQVRKYVPRSGGGQPRTGRGTLSLVITYHIDRSFILREAAKKFNNWSDHKEKERGGGGWKKNFS